MYEHENKDVGPQKDASQEVFLCICTYVLHRYMRRPV